MTNLPRAQKLIKLLQLEQMGRADEKLWAERIRKHLERRGGHAPRQRPHDDPAGVWSLVA